MAAIRKRNGLPNTAESSLTGGERRWAGGASVVLFVVALFVLFRPPTRTTESGVVHTGVRQATEYTTVVSDVSAVLSVLFAVAAVLVLVAVLGRRFSSVTLPGVTLGDKPKAEETTPEAANAEIEAPRGTSDEDEGDKLRTPNLGAAHDDGPSRLRTDPGEAPDPALWDGLSDWVRGALLDWANSGQEVLTSPIRMAVIDARKAPGRGNHPWFVSVKMDNGSVRVFRIATGRGGVSTTDDS